MGGRNRILIIDNLEMHVDTLLIIGTFSRTLSQTPQFSAD